MARGRGGMQKVVPDTKAIAGEWPGGAERTPPASGDFENSNLFPAPLAHASGADGGSVGRP